MIHQRVRPLLVLAVSILGLAGCSSSTSSSSTTQPPSAPVTSIPPATTVVTAPVADPSPAGTIGTKPTVTVPTGPAPTQLEVKDLITGSGPSAASGDKVTVQYVGVSYSTGAQFDASWDRSQPFPFVLGQGSVIPGWDAGIVGMQVGGRRELIIPPALAYGPSGRPPVIAANETLIFIVDLVKIG